MSTRAQIGIFNDKPGTGTPGLANSCEVLIYKHCDGYPESKHGVLALIVPYLRYFVAQRGWEMDYLAARLIGFLTGQSTLDGDVISYGVEKPGSLHGDIEYFYAIYPGGIICYAVPYDSDNWEQVEHEVINAEQEGAWKPPEPVTT